MQPIQTIIEFEGWKKFNFGFDVGNVSSVMLESGKRESGKRFAKSRLELVISYVFHVALGIGCNEQETSLCFFEINSKKSRSENF